ncbi:MAG: hypothetical protein HY657_11675 [Acidobacteria bacterium]|nr:hypothetical protein [Acidobacteriota bacterium]
MVPSTTAANRVRSGTGRAAMSMVKSGVSVCPSTSIYPLQHTAIRADRRQPAADAVDVAEGRVLEGIFAAHRRLPRLPCIPRPEHAARLDPPSGHWIGEARVKRCAIRPAEAGHHEVVDREDAREPARPAGGDLEGGRARDDLVEDDGARRP